MMAMMQTAVLLVHVVRSLPCSAVSPGTAMCGCVYRCGAATTALLYHLQRVRVFDPATGNVKNYVGSGQIGNTPGYTVSSGQTPAASLDTPYAVVSTSDCKLYITDAANNVIWSVSGDNVAIYAGQAGSPGLAGDTSNDPTTARFNTPKGIWVDSSSNITYIVDSGNHVSARESSSSCCGGLAAWMIAQQPCFCSSSASSSVLYCAVV